MERCKAGHPAKTDMTWRRKEELNQKIAGVAGLFFLSVLTLSVILTMEIGKVNRRREELAKGSRQSQEQRNESEETETFRDSLSEVAVETENVSGTPVSATVMSEAELVPFEGVVSHVFFHSLIVDTDRAFDGDYREEGYNYWMTTVSEFEAMLEELYARDYILISIHDLAETVTAEDGSLHFQKKPLMLPEGKTPLILSVDDVNYYTYMASDGFADRLVVADNGKVQNEYRTPQGEVVVGAYDVIPILDAFIEEHPDFSYNGARGLIAETGYNGALGYHYRMKSDVTGKYELVENYVQLMEEARVVADALKAQGWEFAVHGWGHKHTNEIAYETLVEDTQLWLCEVGSIVGETDVYIYPYGEEVSADSDKFAYLQSQGFRYFCGVDSNPFLLIRDTYIRSARRNLDGYSMNYRPERLGDLFDVASVMDSARPPFPEQ